jgi:hypothetical protein
MLLLHVWRRSRRPQAVAIAERASSHRVAIEEMQTYHEIAMAEEKASHTAAMASAKAQDDVLVGVQADKSNALQHDEKEMSRLE